MPHRKRLKVNRHSVSLECLMRQLFLLALLIAVTRTSSLDGSDHHGGKVAGEQQEERKWYQKAVSDAGVKMGQIDLDDLDDLPLKGLSDTQALGLLFQRYKARMMHQAEPLDFGTEDFSEREIAEICGNSASMECGKKVLKHTPVSSNSAKENVTTNTDVQDQMTVYHRCVLRKEFLDCIDIERTTCRHFVDKGIYPRLPPKSIIRTTQSKIWRTLWTSGGCTLIN
ncbi:uncharacterized protein LOC110844937 isoform X2 [Folsomia candida]|uniref:Uncharacterized protein n=1 Tax=Folsomia candida TaxID=158441 RepID=A0A226EQ48_FOLCA|nr:uncharacterized protein LOC110844937 isoform X2 [Folsomia candida]OXA59619.1 hypothetical protein Fcan01_05504 [Folsomia candida]